MIYLSLESVSKNAQYPNCNLFMFNRVWIVYWSIHCRMGRIVHIPKMVGTIYISGSFFIIANKWSLIIESNTKVGLWIAVDGRCLYSTCINCMCKSKRVILNLLSFKTWMTSEIFIWHLNQNSSNLSWKADQMSPPQHESYI